MVETFTLDNGARLVVEEIPWVESVSIGFFILVGAAYEPRRINGVSHFLEHMVFKGSNKRTARDIVRQVESLGGIINAATGKEFTNYYVKIYHKHIHEAVDILTDFVFKPRLDEADIEREKGVIIEEIKMTDDDPDEFIVEQFYRNVFGDTPLGRKIAGSASSISALTRDDILNYHCEYYCPSNLVISAAGNIKGAVLKKMIEKTFRSARLWSPGKSRGNALPPTRPRFRPVKFIVSKDVEQTTLIAGYPSVSVYNPERYTFALIDAHLAGGMSSRLFQEVREKRGLVYSIDSNQAPMGRCGLYTIEAGMNKANAPKVARIVARELRNIVANGVPPRALKNAREYMKGVIILALENSTARMSRNAVNEIYFRRQITLSELMGYMDDVDTSKTQAVATKVFNNANLGIGVLTSNGDGASDGLLKTVEREFTAD